MSPSNYLAIPLLIFGLVQTFSATDVKAQSTADQLRAIERQRLRALVDADVATASRLHAAGRAVTFWRTDFYEKRKGQWQVVWAHATQLNEALEYEINYGLDSGGIHMKRRHFYCSLGFRSAGSTRC